MNFYSCNVPEGSVCWHLYTASSPPMLCSGRELETHETLHLQVAKHQSSWNALNLPFDAFVWSFPATFVCRLIDQR